MAAFIPFAGKNSIAEVAFALQFGQSLAPIVASHIDSLKAALIESFPRFDTAHRLQVSFGLQPWTPGAAQATEVSGFSASRIRADGKPSRVAQLMENFLSVHFLEYEHWDDTKSQALKTLSACLAILQAPSDAIPLISVSLRFIDRFTFDGPNTDARASQLLKNGSRFVPSAIYHVGSKWHSNSGWFETSRDGSTTLHSFSAQGIEDGSSAIVINHNAQCTLAHPWVLGRDLTLPDIRSVESIFDSQHESNKTVLLDLLSDAMLAQIGLK